MSLLSLFFIKNCSLQSTLVESPILQDAWVLEHLVAVGLRGSLVAGESSTVCVRRNPRAGMGH